ncbi:MAG TPA: hypothetical protein VII75_05555 [Thermoanaerobaculia bacterium]|nr:hypothetical protein [Thermoanaerobaculia bacterium]
MLTEFQLSASMSGQVVITSVVTRQLLDEYRLFRESFRVHHHFEPLCVVRCDAAASPFVEAMPNTIAISALSGDDRPVSQWSNEFRTIVRHKMLAMRDTWQLLSPSAVVFIDADVVVLRPFIDALREFSAPVTLSPHYWTYDHDRRSNAYGFYNAGLVLCRDDKFTEWWLDAFDRSPELYADQGCLNAVPELFAVEHFPETWNVGYWRHRNSPGDIPPIPADAFTVHAHVFATARPEIPYEIAQKQFVLAMIDFLKGRGTSADRHLLDFIMAVAIRNTPDSARHI